MFEYQIQKAWKSYKKDFGLGRIALFVCFHNAFMFLTTMLFLGGAQSLYLLSISCSLIFYFLRDKIVEKGNLTIFIMNAVLLSLTVGIGYYVPGRIDEAVGGFDRMDQIFVNFDNWLWGSPISLILENFLRSLGSFGTFLYDLFMVNYVCYFLLPFYAGIIYYRQLSRDHKYKLGRMFASYILFFLTNFLLYMIVPVTGPQYFLRDIYTTALPFSEFGQYFYNSIQQSQPTFIDCFPSGHFGISLLSTAWLFRLDQKPHKYIMVFLMLNIMFATLANRYHYTLDLLASIPLCIFAYKGGRLLFPTGIEKKGH